jgi:hypothetical protein
VPLADGLRRQGLSLQPQPLSSELKADIYGSLKRALNLGRLELLDDSQLAAELVRLEVRPTPSGKPRIQAAGSGRDDLAMVVATVVHALQHGAGLSSSEVAALSDLQSSLRARNRYDALPSLGSLSDVWRW